MGRKKISPAEQQGPDFVDATPPEMAEQEARVRQVIEQTNENAQALARDLNYEGTLTVPDVESNIRFYERRTAEACLELGKCFLILKELTPHGEFTGRVEGLGFGMRMAQKFMATTLKFAKCENSSLLKAAGSQAKLLELVVLDDGEIEALETSGTARGVTLDEIETMSPSELRASLRKAKQTIAESEEVQGRLLEQKDKKINQLHKKVHDHKKKTQEFDYRINEYLIETMTVAGQILSLYDRLDQLRDIFLNDDFGEENEAATQAMAETYYDAMQQVAAKTEDVAAACDEVFSGYKS